ncbi:hypothetical protein BC829DRAFT_401257 [Chytridium lagenaria]|nr:hypothetical protein BC829DRAFT_401257 [Chytridium lagenaria]
MTWVEKETRRRVFYTILSIDQIDFLFREKSSGLWKMGHSVRPISTMVTWLSVDGATGEPTVVSSNQKDVDLGLIALRLGQLFCQVTEHNVCRGTIYFGAKGPLGMTTQEQMNLIHSVSSTHRGVMMSPPADTFGATLTPTVLKEDDLVFAYLDTEITKWLESFPPGFHPGSIATAVQFSTPLPPLDKGLPPYMAIKFHLYYYSLRLALHRPRMMAELEKAVKAFNGMASNVDFSSDALKQVWSKMGRESFQKCREAAFGIIRVVVRRIQVLSPSPLPQGPPRPVFVFVGVPEARAILEAGIQHIVVAMMFSVGVTMASRGMVSGYGEGPTSVIEMIVEEVDGKRWDGVGLERRIKEMRDEALEGLAVAMAVLRDVRRRKASGVAMSEMLERLVVESGIEVGGQVKEFEESIGDIRMVDSVMDHSHLVC